jgi:Xaa-Pro aminopeptidase
MAWLSGEGRPHPADEQAAGVLQAMIAATRPGATLGAVLEAASQAYEAAGLPGEWRNHHQGGTIGYGPRERVATPGDETRLEAGMALAWNPSVPGGKAEATLLLHDDGPETILV